MKEIAGQDIPRYLGLLEGILTGIMADGVVNDLEIAYLEYWLDTVAPYTALFPFSLLEREVSRITADGVVDQEERDHLHRLIQSFITPGGLSDDEVSLEEVLLDIPLDKELSPRDLAPLQNWIAHNHTRWRDTEDLKNVLHQLAKVFDDMVLTKAEYRQLRAIPTPTR